jgi:hypothetical protein
MKIIIMCVMVYSVQIFSQSYLNVHFNDGSNKNSALSDLQKITISATGEQVNFHLNDGTTATENIADIQKFTLDDFALGEPLPVELSSFTALVNGTSVILIWRTETEVGNYGFEVERKIQDARSETWLKLGFLEGHGNSNSPKNYSFEDENPPAGTVQYRLKQIDTDGQFIYSDIISVEVGIPSRFELKQNFPNPFNPTTNIVYNLPVDGFVTLKIYDVIGNEVDVLVNGNKKAGRYVIEFNAGNLSSGVYFYRINTGSYSASVKMMLLK